MKTKFLCQLIPLLFLLLISLSFPVGATSLDEVKAYIEQGKFEQAVSELNEILLTNPELGEAYLLLGQIHERKAKIFLDMAINEYQKALADEEVRYLAQKELARIWLDEGEYDKVIALLSELEEEKQKKFEVLKPLGLAYFKSGHLTEALEKLEKAQILNPDDAEVVFSLAQIYEDKQLFEEALSSYQKLISLPDVEKLSKIARERINDIQQERIGLTIADIKDPEIREMIITSPGTEDYPEAGAVVLLNKHNYLVKEDNTMVEKIHRLIKILNVRGRERYGEINIDYDSTYETVKIDYARTIKPDGNIVRVGKKDVRDVDRWAGFPLYSNAKVKIISMPEVVDGSIIEYQATIFTSKLINEDDFQFRFGLQYFEPYLRHRVQLTIPRGRKISIHYVRLEDEEPKVSQIDDLLIYEWKVDNVPEIIAEPNMPSWTDISPLIMVSSFESWEEFSRWWRDLSQGQPEPTPDITQKVKELIEGKLTPEEKARAIYHWVALNIRYVGLEFGIAGFKPHTAEEIFNNKYGDCKDKATLLLAMYKVAGIPAYYALIGTRRMGKLEENIPMSHFNHAIVLAEVEGEMVWLDPTAEIASYGETPGENQEKLALVFFPEKAKFLRVPLKSSEENRLRTEIAVDINLDASIDVQMEMLTSGATDMSMRTFKYVKPARRKQIVEDWINSIAPGAKLKDYSFSDLEDMDTPVRLRVSFSAPDYLKKAGDVWLFTIPGIEVETGEVGKEEREYPMVFSTTSLSIDKAEVRLPSGFEIQHIPQDVYLEFPYAFFKSSYQAIDGTIFYEGVLERKESEITVSQYPEYKLFRERVSRESQRQIVIKSKK